MKLDKIKNKVKSINNDYRNKKYFFSTPKALIYAWAPYSRVGLNSMHSEIKDYFKDRFQSSIIQNGFDVSYNYKLNAMKADSPIWTIWFQGENNMPPIIKACVDSIKRNAGAHPVTVLTLENIPQLVDIPDLIYKKIEQGVISLTHLADLTRFFILSKYGGLWLDSTVFVTKPISLEGLPMYTIKNTVWRNRYIGGGMNWTAYLFGCGLNNPYMPVMRDVYLNYWLEHDALIDYFMVDYIIEIMYENCQGFRRVIDQIPIDNIGINTLYLSRYSCNTEENWKRLTALRFNKLNRRCGEPTPNSIFERILSSNE